MGRIKYWITVAFFPDKLAKYYEIYPLPKKYRLLEAAEARKKKRKKESE